jgi:hypothetical protein
MTKCPPKIKKKPSFTNSCTSQAASAAASDPTKVMSNARMSRQYTGNCKVTAPQNVKNGYFPDFYPSVASKFLREAAAVVSVTASKQKAI